MRGLHSSIPFFLRRFLYLFTARKIVSTCPVSFPASSPELYLHRCADASLDSEAQSIDVVGGPPANDWGARTHQAFGLVWVSVQVPSFWNDSLT